MGISVDMFVKTYKANSKAKDKTFEDFIDKHIVNTYVPILVKDVHCTKIVESSCHEHETEKELIKINSVGRYISFVMRLIDLYTDIDIIFEEGAFIAQYDKLNEVGAINTLIAAIPESEYAEFSTILNMRMDDFRDNEYSITAMLYNLKQSVGLSEELIKDVLDSPQIKQLLEENTK